MVHWHNYRTSWGENQTVRHFWMNCLALELQPIFKNVYDSTFPQCQSKVSHLLLSKRTKMRARVFWSQRDVGEKYTHTWYRTLHPSDCLCVFKSAYGSIHWQDIRLTTTEWHSLASSFPGLREVASWNRGSSHLKMSRPLCDDWEQVARFVGYSLLSAG